MREILKNILNVCFPQNAKNPGVKIENYFEIWKGLSASSLLFIYNFATMHPYKNTWQPSSTTFNLYTSFFK